MKAELNLVVIRQDGGKVEWRVLPQIKSVIKREGERVEVVEWNKAVGILQKIYDHFKSGKYPPIKLEGDWVEFIRFVSSTQRKLRLRRG